MADDATRKRVMRCVLCRAPVDPDYRPFCSPRCADLDLGNWLQGSYTVPGSAPTTAEELREIEDALEEPESWSEPS